MKPQLFSTISAISILVFCCLASETSYADTITYVTSVGATTSGGSVQGEADFVLGNNSISLTLTNLLQIAPNVMNASQLISGIYFDVSGIPGSGHLADATSSGMKSYIYNNGTYAIGVNDPLTRWMGSKAGDTITFNAFSGGTVNRLIIGPDSGNDFDPTNGGIYYVDNSLHNISVVLGSATFDLTIPGVTANTKISNVTFLFGTDSANNDNKVAGVSPVPESSTILLLGIGLVGSGLVARRQKRHSELPSANRAELKSC
jgi:hypothetical protein